MKLSRKQEKLFHSIQELKQDFSKNWNKNKDYAEMLSHKIKNKCEYLERLFYDELETSTKSHCDKKQAEYDVIKYIQETNDFLDNFMTNPPQGNALQDYLEGLKNGNN